TGLLPDTSLLGKGWDTFYDFNSCTASKDNYLPFCLGTKLRQRGYRSYGVHYYYNNYYGRNRSYPNFGFDFISMNHGLSYSSDWPTSDLQMMQQFLPTLLEPDESGNIGRFGAYFLTFSGHMQYNYETNNVARRNRDVAKEMEGLSTATKAFVSCNQELEYALEYTFDELEKAGVLDNTLIVLLPDHYPYALGLTKLSELAGKNLEADSFEKEFNTYKGTLMMWTPSMEAQTVETTCCELDVLPTLLNLLGIDFDSRLLMGTDIFSTSEHVAILGDRSFVTKDLFYNASDGTSRSRTEEPVDENTVNRLVTAIKNKFTVSTEILYTDYYRQLR
ncbi:MAG: sulfatase-like hydrolase/transferase, partial [Firmicutes bacterium]|nr:sulfatase-like hydrolase/transferase [Bacillota bacterium]